MVRGCGRNRRQKSRDQETSSPHRVLFDYTGNASRSQAQEAPQYQWYDRGMKRAGFVLAGGASSRMGRDKALLPLGRKTLLEHVAAQVRAAAGSVTVVGPPERYERLGLAVVPDVMAGCGPLGGILTALTLSPAEWNLIVACDLPGVTSTRLRNLLDAAERIDADCLMPVGAADQPQPLCAVWRRTCLPAVQRATREGRYKVTEALSGLVVMPYRVAEPDWLLNVNTPEDWAAWEASLVVHG
jgi:molybdopterin-guanine dinucleotide biosynthesis protein A